MAGRQDYRVPLLAGTDDLELETEEETMNSGDESLQLPAIEVHEVKNNKHKHDTGRLKNYEDKYYSGLNNRQYTCCSPVSFALIVAFCLLGLFSGYIAGIFTNVFVQKQLQIRLQSRGTWRTRFEDYGTESCVRLVDADGDGLDDIILGLALAKDISFMLTEDAMEDFCHSQGLEVPCAGAVVALRGYDGKLLWQTTTYAEIFELNCHAIDVNSDGVKDCIATGRLGDVRAIDVTNGATLWASDGRSFNRGWNVYSSAALPDLDYDGVPELVVSHGGDPTIPAQNTSRHAGWLMMLSGATGRPIGKPLLMPEDKETYCVPVIHTLDDGSQYILFGSGGETVGGLLMAISIPDFYRYVHGYPHNHNVPGVIGRYNKWEATIKLEHGVVEIYRSTLKGVMVPPVLVEMTGDKVKDILMSAFDGTVTLYDGLTLAQLWSVQIEGRESYSTPAPGYFNDDNVIDFMIQCSEGAWPLYNSTNTVVLDGRDGSVLWNLTTWKYDVTSDLVARTTASNRDVFLFKTQGRQGREEKATGAIHGATGIQRIVNRDVIDGKSILKERGDDIYTENLDRETDDYLECSTGQAMYTAEMFAMDRTMMDRPLKIWELGSEKYYYKLTESDRDMAEKVREMFGDNFTTTEEEVPWARGRRSDNSSSVFENKMDNSTSLDTVFCVLVQPDERTTGAVGDVDGDGKLDVIINAVSVGVLRDEHARFVKLRFTVDIFKVSLEEQLEQRLYTPLNVTVHNKMAASADDITPLVQLKFLNKEKQTWGGYLGTYGDSIYRGDSVS